MGELLLRISFGIALGNDFFNPLVLPALGERCFDDDGFTNDLSAWARVCGQAECFTLDGRHRMLTERGGLRRTDELDIRARAAHLLQLDRKTQLVVEEGTALALSGNLGGELLQDAMHRVVRGRRLDGSGQGQLQNVFPDQTRVGVVLSWTATLSRELVPWLRVGNSSGGALALGRTGLSELHSTAFIQANVSLTSVLGFDLSASISINRQTTTDPSLTRAGGYNIRDAFITTEMSAGISLRPMRLGFSLRTNEGGACANFGVFSLSFSR